MSYKILLVDDENDILEFLSYNLSKENFKVVTASNGIEALNKLSEKPDLIILDVMMPKLDGYETCKEIRKIDYFKTTPIIFLTAKKSESDEILALNVGGDDFITKPISPQKLIARIKAKLRKINTNPAELIYEFGPIKIDNEKHQIFINDKEIFFPKKEYELLKLLIAHKGKILSRKIILNEIWGNDIYVVERTIDVHIRKIREKLGKYDYLLETIKGVGYKLRDKID
ncbi:MAG: response regulator transcription factor [Melioribacteraceae bacterium]|nr:response regulator transcription factor [Melioribacteraceae bacterium]